MAYVVFDYANFMMKSGIVRPHRSDLCVLPPFRLSSEKSDSVTLEEQFNRAEWAISVFGHIVGSSPTRATKWGLNESINKFNLQP